MSAKENGIDWAGWKRNNSQWIQMNSWLMKRLTAYRRKAVTRNNEREIPRIEGTSGSIRLPEPRKYDMLDGRELTRCDHPLGLRIFLSGIQNRSSFSPSPAFYSPPSSWSPQSLLATSSSRAIRRKARSRWTRNYPARTKVQPSQRTETVNFRFRLRSVIACHLFQSRTAKVWWISGQDNARYGE
jgi:hypothetical protein